MENFKINFVNIIRYYFLTPLIVLVFYGGYIFNQTNNTDTTIVLAFVLLISLPRPLIFINHYLYFEKIIFKYDKLQHKFYYSRNNETITFKKEEIVSIDEYRANTGQRFVDTMRFWEINLQNGKQVKLALIIIGTKKVYELFSDYKMNVKSKFFLTK